MNPTQRLGLIGLGAGALVAVAVAAYLVLFSGSGVNAGSTILTIIGGDVRIQEDGSAAERTAADGEEVSQGDRIVTGTDGRAVITFFDGSTQTIGPDTDITLEKVASNSSGGLTAEVRQDQGTTWNNVLRPEDSFSDFKVSTPAAVGAVRDTAFLVTVDIDGTTEFWSRLGTVDVESEGESVAVGPGTSSVTDPGDAPGDPKPKPRSDSEVQMELASSAWLLVVDPTGYAAGILPPGVPVNQIPLTLITDYTQEPQKVYMLDLMEDTYQVYLLGKETGDFHLTALGTTHGTAVDEVEIKGSAVPDQILRSEMDIELDSSGKLAGLEISDPVEVDKITGLNVYVQQYVLDLIGEGRFHFPANLVAGAVASPSPTASPSSTTAPTPTHTATPTPTPKPVVAGVSALCPHPRRRPPQLPCRHRLQRTRRGQPRRPRRRLRQHAPRRRPPHRRRHPPPRRR